MKFATELLITVFALFLSTISVSASDLRQKILRQYAIDAGLVPPEAVLPPISAAKSAAGRLLFESKELSMSREIACKNCHLNQFGSADGLSNAFGTQAQGEGIERALGGGDILPRNTLPLWGRGAIGFDVFFWDGRVDGSTGTVRSQFGEQVPSKDPLVVAAHLPLVEIREMIPDIDTSSALKTESVATAQTIYAEVVSRIRADPQLSKAISSAFEVSPDDIQMVQIAESIATFYRDRFRLRETPFHRFVFRDGPLSNEEIAGGLLFYGKARCSTCHNGAFFSDLSFHAIPFGQLGYGKNGFGIDYGRYNVTLNPDDRYKFRTPPLYNVLQTAPYSHSGSVFDLNTAIRSHVDPLGVLNLSELSDIQRVEFYKRLRVWSDEPIYEVYLDDQEIDALVAFLGTLSFPDPELGSTD